MNKKNNFINSQKLNSNYLSEWMIKKVGENTVSIWECNNKDKNIKPINIILNVQKILKDKYIQQTDEFWMQHCCASLRELIDKNFESFLKSSKNTENKFYFEKCSEVIEKLKVYREFFNNFVHFRKYSQTIDSANEIPIFKSKNEKIKDIDENNFTKIFISFIKTIYKYFENQVEIHNIINKLDKNPKKYKVEEIQSLIGANENARIFFYKAVSNNWLSWLSANNFFDVLKEKSNEITCFPEMWYLHRIVQTSSENSDKVVSIMCGIKISKDNFNQEIVNEFTTICSLLPANALVDMLIKIRDEKWVQLVKGIGSWQYSKMFKTLVEIEKYHDDILILAEAVLEVKIEKDFRLKEKHKSSGIGEETTDIKSNKASGYVYYPRSNCDYFYFDFRSNPYIKIFEYLTDISDEYIEKTLKFLCKTISKIVKLQGKNDDSKDVFDFKDEICLANFDFFTLDLNKSNHTLSPDIIEKLLASIKKLIQKIIDKNCENTSFIINIYEKYFKPLPDNCLLWRLRLFFMSLCPNVFQNNLKKAFLRLFKYKKTDNYGQIQSGTEYKKALKKSFKVFDSKFQRKFVKKVFEFFEKVPKYDQHIGGEILSSICEFLTKNEKNKCKFFFGETFNPNFKPTPALEIMGKTNWCPKGFVTQEIFNNMSISEIVKKLKNEWNLENIKKLKNNFESNPIHSDGIIEQLKLDFACRPAEYISNANLFFDKDLLYKNYTYSFFRSVEKIIKDNSAQAKKIDWSNLIDVMTTISQSVNNSFFYQNEKQIFSRWTNSWQNVFLSIIDIIKLFLNPKEDQPVINIDKFHDKFFRIIVSLLESSNLEYKERKSVNSSLEIQKKDFENCNLDFITNNSLQGKAFKAFVFLDYWVLKNNKNEIKQKIKDVFENVLKKANSSSLMYMFGKYLGFFYIWDKNWILKLLSQIFPTDKAKQHLYIASWEGYLKSNSWNGTIFFDSQFQKLYERWFELKNNKFNESIVEHFASIFIIYHKKFGFEHELFKKFWEENIDRQAKFIDFVGKNFIFQEKVKENKKFKNSNEIRGRIWELWEWILNNSNDSKIFESFGFWINAEKGFFNLIELIKRIKKTLEKSKGILTQPFLIEESINKFAEISPLDTLEIIRLFFLEGKNFMIQKDEWKKCLKTLYEKAKTKKDTIRLISDLVKEKYEYFQEFKKIIKKTEI